LVSSNGFFKTNSASSAQLPLIQIPSASDLESMQGLYAAEDEDQATRLQHISQAIQEAAALTSAFKIEDNQSIIFPQPWQTLFQQIKQGQHKQALATYKDIAEMDRYKSALLGCHAQAYIEELIENCSRAEANQPLEFAMDVAVNRGTFETLIRDMAFALLHSGMLLSFGLPTHHAYSSYASGFCLLNKTAVLIKQCQAASAIPIIIGLDVNRDDGLNQILCDDEANHPFFHIDVFDSRVYPWHKVADIKNTLEEKGFHYQHSEFVHQFQRGDQRYHLINLTSFRRKNLMVHPAIDHAVNVVEEEIMAAVSTHRQIQIFLPTGWDSHSDETAQCSSLLNNHSFITSAGKMTQRFKDADFNYFFEHLFHLYQQNKEYISRFYFGLEGGYNPAMYLSQLNHLLSIVNEQSPEHSPHTDMVF